MKIPCNFNTTARYKQSSKEQKLVTFHPLHSTTISMLLKSCCWRKQPSSIHPVQSPRSPAQDSSLHLCSITTSASDTSLTTAISLKTLHRKTCLYFSDGFPHLLNVSLFKQRIRTQYKTRLYFSDGFLHHLNVMLH